MNMYDANSESAIKKAYETLHKDTFLERLGDYIRSTHDMITQRERLLDKKVRAEIKLTEKADVS